MEKISAILNNERVANVFFSLYERWTDEYKYEDINDYGKALCSAIEKTGTGIVFKSATKRPFGVKVAIDGSVCHVFVKAKGRSLVLCEKVLEKRKEGGVGNTLVSQDEYDDMGEEERSCYVFASYVYAHGELEDDMKTDLVCVRKGCTLADGLEGEYNGRPVVFHLYDSRFGHKTGVVTYKDDAEACEYGRKLVAEKPRTF